MASWLPLVAPGSRLGYRSRRDADGLHMGWSCGPAVVAAALGRLAHPRRASADFGAYSACRLERWWSSLPSARAGRWGGAGGRHGRRRESVVLASVAFSKW